MLKTKKVTMVLLMAIMVSMIFGMLAPGVAFAGGTKNVFDGFEVIVDGEGVLTVDTGEKENENSWGRLIAKYQEFITGIAAVGAVTMVVLFIIQFLKLGASAGNPNARSQAMVGVLWTGLAAAGLGAVALITGIFYRAIEAA